MKSKKNSNPIMIFSFIVLQFIISLENLNLIVNIIKTVSNKK